MKVTNGHNNVSISMAPAGRAEEWAKGNGQDKKKEGGSIYAGDLNMPENKILDEKRRLLKNALKSMKDQFKTDCEIDDNLTELKDKMSSCEGRMKEATEKVNELDRKKTELLEKYGVAEDSQEQKDLELIERGRRARKEGRLGELSEEELDRLAEMGPLTSYQRESLAYTSIQEIWQEDYNSAGKERVNESQVIRSITNSLDGRQYDMTDAARESGQMRKQVSRQLTGMMMSEAKEHVDEEFKKLREEAEKAKEKKEAEEEQKEVIQEAKAKNGQAEEIREDRESMKQQMADVLKLAEEVEIPEEDMKGLVVNLMI